MVGPLFASLLSGWMPGFSADLNLATQIDSESGLVSLAPGEQPNPIVNISLIPSARIALGFRHTDLTLSYDLRLLQRFDLDTTDETDLDAFLQFHNLSARAEHRLARGWTLSEAGAVNLGLADFATVGLLGTSDLDGGTGGAVQGSGSDEALWLFGAEGSTSLVGELTRNWRFSLSGQVSWSSPITGTEEARSAFIALLLYSFGGGVTWQATGRDSVSVNLTSAWSSTSSTTASDVFRTVSANLTYRRNLTRATILELQTGIAVIEQLSTSVEPPDDTQLTPLAGFQLSTTLHQVREAQIQLALGGYLSAIPNPQRGTTELAATANLNMTAVFPPYWTLGMQLNFSSPLECDDANESDCAPDRLDMATDEVGNLLNCTGDLSDRSDLTCQEAIWSVAVPVTYQPSSDWQMQFGLRVTLFGPRVSAPGALDFTSINAVGYLGLTSLASVRL